MSISTVTRAITLAIVLTSYVSASVANAEQGQQSGKRRGPPPEAFASCADQTEGDVCAFSARHGEVSGTCIVPPRGEEALVCAPEGGPPHGDDEREVAE